MTLCAMELQRLIQLALDRHASDIHIRAHSPVAIRIGGLLHKLEHIMLTEKTIQEMLTPYCPENILSSSRPAIDIAIEIDTNTRARLNISHDSAGLCCAIRLLNKTIPDLESLHIPPAIIELLKKTSGLILVTGATGNGKSTTLAAMLEHINQHHTHHIITLEDPIEYHLLPQKSHINHIHIGHHTDSFATGLTAALRQDPDVIMIGECRDTATLTAMLHAAETGHLVMATLHTRSASQSLERIISTFPSNQHALIQQLLAQNLLAVMNQKLLLGDDNQRHANFELLINTPAVAQMIRDGQFHQIDHAIATGRQHGMISFDEHCRQSSQEGIITA